MHHRVFMGKLFVSSTSKTYVFYEQYLTIIEDTFWNLVASMCAVFVVTFILMGFDLWSSLVAVFTIALIINSLLALMYLWDITLNAVSLVNIVMVGITVTWAAGVFKYT